MEEIDEFVSYKGKAMQFGQTYVEFEANETMKELISLFYELLEADDITKIDYMDDQVNQALSS